MKTTKFRDLGFELKWQNNNLLDVTFYHVDDVSDDEIYLAIRSAEPKKLQTMYFDGGVVRVFVRGGRMLGTCQLPAYKQTNLNKIT